MRAPTLLHPRFGILGSWSPSSTPFIVHVRTDTETETATSLKPEVKFPVVVSEGRTKAPAASGATLANLVLEVYPD